jgi:hypothetical protein
MAKKKTNASASIDPTITLAKLSEMYLEHMEQDGKSVGTCFSYTMELKSAIAEIGGDTLVSELTPHLIERFNACDRVMLLKSGKPKAQPSIDKTRRVIRLALTWAAQIGLIASAPYPTKDAEAANEAASDAPAADAAPAKAGKGAKGRKGAKRAEPEASTTAEPVEQEMATPAA